MKKLGILIESLNISQQSMSLIVNCNRLSNDTDIDVIGFYEIYGQFPTPPHFSLIQNRNIWEFNGPIIATDIDSAYTLINCPLTPKKYLYLWNLEWIFHPANFYYYNAIYNHKEIELIARSEYHKKIIEKIWKRPKFIMENFNHEVLAQIAG